jgi:hypothetical protein
MKTKRYWFNGALVGLFLTLVRIFWDLYSWCGVRIDAANVECTPKLFIEGLITQFKFHWFDNLKLVVVFICIGVVLGFIYGKLKNRGKRSI